MDVASPLERTTLQNLSFFITMVVGRFDSSVISKLIKHKQKTIIMKKVLAIFAVASLVVLASCGGKATTEATTDSTAVATDSVSVDSTATPAVDSTATTAEVK